MSAGTPSNVHPLLQSVLDVMSGDALRTTAQQLKRYRVIFYPADGSTPISYDAMAAHPIDVQQGAEERFANADGTPAPGKIEVLRVLPADPFARSDRRALEAQVQAHLEQWL